MTGQMGGAARRVSAGLFSFVLLASALPGTNWTLAPVDQAITPGDFALVQVYPGSASAVAARATATGATDVAALGAVNVVTARMTAGGLRALRGDARGVFI